MDQVISSERLSKLHFHEASMAACRHAAGVLSDDDLCEWIINAKKRMAVLEALLIKVEPLTHAPNLSASEFQLLGQLKAKSENKDELQPSFYNEASFP